MLDVSKEVVILNLGLARGLTNQHITSCAIQGARGYGPNARQIKMSESLVDLNNQLLIKAGGELPDPLAQTKLSMGLKPMGTETPAPPVVKTAEDKQYKNMNKKLDVLVHKFDGMGAQIADALVKALNGGPAK